MTAVASTRSACSVVDVIALLHGAHAAHARIFIGESAHEVVEQSLAHRALGDAYAIDAEVLDDLQQDRQTGRKHRRALGIDVLEIEIVHMTRRDHALGQAAQVVERDSRRIGIEPAHHIADDAHRAGTAERLQPAELAIRFLNGLEFEPDRRAGPLEALLGDSAVVEENGGQADAAHRQALEQQRIESFADDDLGRAAADIDHQPLVRAHGARVRDARVDQARLFEPGDDLDGVPERRPSPLQEPTLAFCAPQCVGADHSHAIRMHGAQPLPKALEAAQALARRPHRQPAAVVQTGGEPHHLAQPVQI